MYKKIGKTVVFLHILEKSSIFARGLTFRVGRSKSLSFV